MTIEPRRRGTNYSAHLVHPHFHIFSYSSGVVSTSGEAAVHILCTHIFCDGEGFSIQDSIGRGSLCPKYFLNWDFSNTGTNICAHAYSIVPTIYIQYTYSILINLPTHNTGHKNHLKDKVRRSKSFLFSCRVKCPECMGTT